MDRRSFLKNSTLVAAVPLLPGCGSDADKDGSAGADGGADIHAPAGLLTYSWDGDIGPESLFSHGVASGDPFSDSVLLWTRVTVDGTELAGKSAPAFWEVATDEAFTERVAAGETTTSGARDYTVKVVAAGLNPGTTYYYRFLTHGRASPLGRTRTATVGSTKHLRLGFCSCANYVRGYFIAYRALAVRNDLDAVLHLGDYMYESKYTNTVRPNKPDKETITLQDYRIRYAHYRTDKDLQEVHRQHPFICVWDDHETANNSYKDGAGNHDSSEGKWSDRKAAATKAWHEWLPVRESEDGRIWRQHAWGDLVDLYMLDTRLWARAKQTTGSNKVEINDPNRLFLGADQEKWLHDGITASKARWQVLGQQVMMGQLTINGAVVNTDQWDGYAPTRDRLFKLIRDEKVDGLIVLTGDIHSSWANDLVEDSNDPAKYDVKTGKGALGVEFVVPGVTSSTFGAGSPGIGALAAQFNPHIRWSELTQRGYGVLDLQPDAAQCDWFLFVDVDKPDIEQTHGASFRTDHGSGHLTKVAEPMPARGGAPKLAS